MTGRAAGAPAVELVMPVHQEAGSIAATLAEWLAVSDRGATLSVLVAEDGSTDGTRSVVSGLADPAVRLMPPAERKGYSRAVADALATTTSDWVCTVDGDGQYDPDDLAALLAARRPDAVVVGVRSPRRDPWQRRAMSWCMNLAFMAIHGIRMADASSPFCLMTGETARAIGAEAPVLPQGYWWEFHVRRRALGIDVVEVPVRHRARPSGTTQVYLPRRLPSIALVHLRGLWSLRA